jgi:hypothetical protein
LADLKPGAPVDLCLIDPGHDVDLFVFADLKAMTSAWMGLSSLKVELSRGKISMLATSQSRTPWKNGWCSSYACCRAEEAKLSATP